MEDCFDVNVCRGEGEGMSDHFLVEARLQLVGGWRSVGWMDGVRNVLKVSELNKRKERAYKETLRGKYEVMRGGDVDSVETKWEMFRDIVKECANGVCGVRRVGEQRRNGILKVTKR